MDNLIPNCFGQSIDLQSGELDSNGTKIIDRKFGGYTLLTLGDVNPQKYTDALPIQEIGSHSNYCHRNIKNTNRENHDVAPIYFIHLWMRKKNCLKPYQTPLKSSIQNVLMAVTIMPFRIAQTSEDALLKSQSAISAQIPIKHRK